MNESQLSYVQSNGQVEREVIDDSSSLHDERIKEYRQQIASIKNLIQSHQFKMSTVDSVLDRNSSENTLNNAYRKDLI